MKTYQKILLTLTCVILALFIGFFTYYFYVTGKDRLDGEKLSVSYRNVVILDKEGEEVQNGSLSALKKTASIRELSDKTKQAFIAVEDKRFYKHHGFDYKRMVKAALTNLKKGSFSQGASTISQQLIKNTHLSQEKTLSRKLREFKLTRRLEKNYTKEQILEKYLNTIYFGHSCFGIQSASEFYFGKEPSALTIAESAILAGLVRSPNNYSPFKRPLECEKRRNVVLSLMKSQNLLTNDEYQAAILEPLPKRKSISGSENEKFLSAAFDELEDIAQEKGFSIAGEITVYTALDKKLQEKIEQTARLVRDCDVCISALDTKTRLFKGYYSTVGNIRRAPASLIKPLLVYAPALEEEILSPATPILDERTNFSGYSPKNYDDAYRGYVSVRECLSKSLNVPAVKILNQTGVKKSVSYLEKMNLKIDEDDYSLALALGGMKEGFTLNQLLGGYATLANGGTYANCGFIEKILLGKKVVYEKSKEETTVFSPSTAYLTTDILKTAALDGTAKKLRSLNIPIAAKTGTAGIDGDNKDAYSISYTTKDVLGVWLGNASYKPIPHTGGGMPTNLLLSINEYLCEDYLRKDEKIFDFEQPNEVVRITLDKEAYLSSQNLLLADPASPKTKTFSELFQKNLAPTKSSKQYSAPTVSTPIVFYENGKIILKIEKTSVYDFLIERTDGKEKKTVFSGRLNGDFIDEDIQENKTYIYTITPIFINNKGTPVITPKISTKNEKDAQKPPPDIVYEEWWQN